MARRSVPRYENSPMDLAEDKRGAGLLGITPAQYEQHPRDRLEDIAGQARLNRAHAAKAVVNSVIASHRGRKR